MGQSKQHKKGEILATPEAYFVRRPDRDNRIVFTLKRQLCAQEITEQNIRDLCEEGRTGLIEGFVSKGGRPFSAYLVLSKAGAKAEFEFPPR